MAVKPSHFVGLRGDAPVGVEVLGG
jgi:hypothetical protein